MIRLNSCPDATKLSSTSLSTKTAPSTTNSNERSTTNLSFAGVRQCNMISFAGVRECNIDDLMFTLLGKSIYNVDEYSCSGWYDLHCQIENWQRTQGCAHSFIREIQILCTIRFYIKLRVLCCGLRMIQDAKYLDCFLIVTSCKKEIWLDARYQLKEKTRHRELRICYISQTRTHVTLLPIIILCSSDPSELLENLS